MVLKVEISRRKFEHTELGVLFFLNAAAIGMWNVPLANVLRAHGYEEIVPYAYACSGISAFISPMIIGALADQRISPTRLVRWLAVTTGGFLALSFYGIGAQWSAGWVLGALQLQSLCVAPVFGLTTAIVMGRLKDPAREFGPIRAWATLGWMAAGVFVSWVIRADTTVASGYAAAATWVLSACSTFLLPEVPVVEVKAHRTWRDIFGLEALSLFATREHRVVFLTAGLFAIPMAAFYPYTPMQLKDLGVTHAAAAMSLGQVSELVAMFAMGRILARVPLKGIFLAGIGFGILRYSLCGVNDKNWLLVGVGLHGFAFAFYFITAQIYLEERVPSRLRARAQALLSVMVGGFGSLFGYLGNGWWKKVNTFGGQTNWSCFWLGLAVLMVGVLVFFAMNYRNEKPGRAVANG